MSLEKFPFKVFSCSVYTLKGLGKWSVCVSGVIAGMTGLAKAQSTGYSSSLCLSSLEVTGSGHSDEAEVHVLTLEVLNSRHLPPQWP